MWFESDTVSLDILIGGYTDRPWYFKTEHMGMNALECQVCYTNEETGRNFVMFDEVFQTEEIAMIRNGLKSVLSGAQEEFIFHSEYETFAIAVWRDGSDFKIIVQVQNIDGNIRESFQADKALLTENYNYLNACCEQYPVRTA